MLEFNQCIGGTGGLEFLLVREIILWWRVVKMTLPWECCAPRTLVDLAQRLLEPVPLGSAPCPSEETSMEEAKRGKIGPGPAPGRQTFSSELMTGPPPLHRGPE